MFNFDLQRFDSVLDDDYNLKQGLRNIIVGHMNNIDNNFLHKESLQFSQSDVTDVMSDATLGGSSTPAAKTEPTLIIDTGFGGNGSYTYNGDGDIFGYVAGYFLKIDRNDKTFTVIGHDDYTPSFVVFDYTITLYASETANFAAKSVSATSSSQLPVTPVI